MEIKKLEDVVAWFDNWIEETKLDLTEEDMKDDTTIKEFETIKKVILESIERHKVYTNALNNDLSDKAAKIELMQKELDGRKAGYAALKARFDHMTALEESWHANAQELVETCKSKNEEINKLRKESEKWQDLAKMNRDTICNQYDVCEEFKKKIAELEEENEKLKVDLIHEREKNEKLAKDHAELENDMRKYTTDIISQSGTIWNLKKELYDTKETLDETIKNCIPLTAYEIAVNDLKEEIKKLEEENKDLKIRDDELTKQVANKLSDIDSLRKYITHWKNQERIRTDQLRATESKVEELWEEIEKLKREDDHGRKGFKRYIEWLVKEEEAKYKESWKVRLNEELEAIFKEEEEAEVNDIPCGEDAIE